MFLYVDGTRVGGSTTRTTGEAYGGYWRLGADSAASGGGFNGSIDDFSVYANALSDAQVRAHWVASGRAAGPDPTAPHASFTTSARGRRVTLRGSGTSTDSTIASYAWHFGDGTTASTQTAVHTYPRSGTYNATLTVTDDRGYSSSTTRRLVVANARPYATFVAVVHKRTVSFNASKSSDPDGRVVSYAWRFGDRKAARGVKVQHRYRKAKKFVVRLTVTDSSGATTTVTRTVRTRRH